MIKLRAKDISVIYHTLDGETEAIKNLNLDVKEGEFLCLVGPSGCGKSTFLNVIAGLVKPSSGKIFIDNEEITKPSNKIGYMFQRDYLFEWRTIYKNIVLGLEIQKRLNGDNLKMVEYMLQKYGLSSFKNYYPRQLSGGMRQRAALIRTLALNPDILLLDEPFAALDYQTRLAVSDDIYRIIKNEGKTVIMVTHDISEAVSLSDRVVVLSKRPARIKDILEIKFSIKDRTPIKVREAPEFKDYFNLIWKELDIHVE
ncbi:ABC transporter ATP-binding protein [Caloramator australicus]|uniref:Hydroxymethylpyrimidine ABC transporter, ATPase component n=1 Tax=Caloramator australicus RC3 TaxID=857293 RepID=G0V4R2_9CLOT|nr:ABC transporter ATP-binding protein [Caloramator australicus]CCC58102.1 Hydroxymethylpyrimidine ABC transporter, ATPase component [Caloramator australicus RC3]